MFEGNASFSFSGGISNAGSLPAWSAVTAVAMSTSESQYIRSS